MTFETALIFAISLTLLWIKPGPGQAFIITRALNDGFWPAFYVVMGITIGAIIFFLIAVLGLGLVTNFFERSGFVFKLIGAAYMFYVGYKGLKNLEIGHWTGRVDKKSHNRFLENFPAALILTLGNPFPIFYFLGFMPTLIPLESLTATDITIGVLIVLGVGLVVDTLIIALVYQVKQLLSDPKIVKKINLVTSISFILIGLFLTYSALFMSNFSFDLL